MSAAYIQIERNGARLWVVGSEEIRPGIHIGIVDGNSDDTIYRDGDTVAYTDKEVRGITTNKAWAEKKIADIKAMLDGDE